MKTIFDMFSILLLTLAICVAYFFYAIAIAVFWVFLLVIYLPFAILDKRVGFGFFKQLFTTLRNK